MFEDYLIDALEIVSGWDLPDEEVAEAVNGQARLMAAIPLDHTISEPIPSPYSALQF